MGKTDAPEDERGAFEFLLDELALRIGRPNVSDVLGRMLHPTIYSPTRMDEAPPPRLLTLRGDGAGIVPPMRTIRGDDADFPSANMAARFAEIHRRLIEAAATRGVPLLDVFKVAMRLDRLPDRHTYREPIEPTPVSNVVLPGIGGWVAGLLPATPKPIPPRSKGKATRKAPADTDHVDHLIGAIGDPKPSRAIVMIAMGFLDAADALDDPLRLIDAALWAGDATRQAATENTSDRARASAKGQRKRD